MSSGQSDLPGPAACPMERQTPETHGHCRRDQPGRRPGTGQFAASWPTTFQAGARPARCAMISAMAVESRPSRCAVASRVLTRRPRPRGMAAARRTKPGRGPGQATWVIGLGADSPAVLTAACRGYGRVGDDGTPGRPRRRRLPATGPGPTRRGAAPAGRWSRSRSPPRPRPARRSSYRPTASDRPKAKISPTTPSSAPGSMPSGSRGFSACLRR
jgi:hypothetical protein